MRAFPGFIISSSGEGRGRLVWCVWSVAAEAVGDATLNDAPQERVGCGSHVGPCLPCLCCACVSVTVFCFLARKDKTQMPPGPVTVTLGTLEITETETATSIHRWGIMYVLYVLVVDLTYMWSVHGLDHIIVIVACARYSILA